MSLDYDITPYAEGWKKRMAEAEAQMAARKKSAYADAQRIAQVLREKYGCTRVGGIGSTFNEKDFTEHSDIDLVVFGLPERKYFSISAEIGHLTSFEVDLIPAKNMLLEIPDVRPPVVSAETGKLLKTFLGFRHKFRLIFGFKLEIEKMKNLDNLYPEAYKKFVEDVMKFIDFLNALIAEIEKKS